MLNYLDQLDKKLLTLINQTHSPFWDQVMLYSTERFFWIPFYALLVIFIFYKDRLRGFITLAIIALMILAADQFASGFMKPVIERLRPCHNEELIGQLRLLKNCGGKFGFISSHAANTFALATFLTFTYTGYRWMSFMFLWAFLVSYSRIYLGVHYPGDIIVGSLSGVLWGVIFSYLHQRVKETNLLKRLYKS